MARQVDEGSGIGSRAPAAFNLSDSENSSFGPPRPTPFSFLDHPPGAVGKLENQFLLSFALAKAKPRGEVSATRREMMGSQLTGGIATS